MFIKVKTTDKEIIHININQVVWFKPYYERDHVLFGMSDRSEIAVTISEYNVSLHDVLNKEV